MALPLLRRTDQGLDAIGISAAYAEQVVVQESLTLPLPNGLPTTIATLTEPMAIDWHAVRRADVKRNDITIVIGYGPVGLAVIGMLEARSVHTAATGGTSPPCRPPTSASAPSRSSATRRTGVRGHRRAHDLDR